MANVMGYLYFRINLFISWHFHDWRHVVLAVQDRTAGQIRAQHQLEVACRCRQPVGLVPGGSRALSTVVVQYAASCATLTAGRILAHAARWRMPLPGWPHLVVVRQPLTVVV